MNTANRLTDVDRATIRAAIRDRVDQEHRPDFYAVRLAALASIGCTAADMREAELLEIEAYVANALEVQR